MTYDRYNKSDIQVEEEETLYYSMNDEGPSVDEYNLEDEEEEVETKEEQEKPSDARRPRKPKRYAPLTAVLRLLLRPVEGWKSILRARYSTAEFLGGCFYPLTGLAGLSCLADLIYNPDATIGATMTLTVVTFMSLLIAYFATVLVIELAMRPLKGTKLTGHDGKIFIMTVTSTLALYTTISNLLPMMNPLTVFMPLYTVYLIMRGIRLLHIPRDKETRVAIELSALTIGIPLLLFFLFSGLGQPETGSTV